MIPKFVVLHFADKAKLTYQESLDRHNELEKFFLEVVQKGTITPSKLVDETWHNFILHTRLYAEYCEKKFGQFIHHNPHIPSFFGLNTCNGTNEEEEVFCDSAFVSKVIEAAHCDAGGDGGGDSGSYCDSQFQPKKLI